MSTSLYFLGLYNTLTNGLKVVGNVSSDLFNALCNFLNGTSNEWYFIENNGPIPASAYQMPYSSYRNRIQFTYNRYNNTLIQGQDGIHSEGLQFNFLSVLLIADGKTYTMDDWIKQLTVVITDYDAFTVRRLVDAWSIYNHIWPDSSAELHIIDNEGQSHTFNINDPVSDEWNALLPVSPEEDAEDAEEQGGDDEDTEETEEDEEVVEEASVSDAVTESTAAPVSDAIVESPVVTESATTTESAETTTESEPTTESAAPANDAPLETVTVTLDSLARLDIAHLSGC